jgi:alpha-L-fucosidase
MFIHFGMSTFDGMEHSLGREPSTRYAPDRLDVDQWIQVARDAGMRYAVLTAKHASGHCLWPSAHTDYHVGTSGNQTDVVEAFLNACRKHGVMAGLYYCSADNHHVIFEPGSFPRPGWNYGTTPQYNEFLCKQLDELLTRYGPVGEIWIDLPAGLGHVFRPHLYAQLARLQPQAAIMMNQGISDGSRLNEACAWPTDLVAIERYLPNSHTGHVPWRMVQEQHYYLPGEVCDPIGRDWFWVEGDQPRSDAELLGMRLVCRERHANLLLDVPPDRHGLIPDQHVQALMRLRRNVERATA